MRTSSCHLIFRFFKPSRASSTVHALEILRERSDRESASSAARPKPLAPPRPIVSSTHRVLARARPRAATERDGDIHPRWSRSPRERLRGVAVEITLDVARAAGNKRRASRQETVEARAFGGEDAGAGRCEREGGARYAQGDADRVGGAVFDRGAAPERVEASARGDAELGD